MGATHVTPSTQPGGHTDGSPLSSDLDSTGFKGLPPFVDVVYGAVFGYGVFKTAEASHFDTSAQGGGVPLFLLVVTSIYLLFDYAQARMCTEKNGYRGLTRYALDIFIAIAFLFAYEEAARRSPYYLVALSILLILGGIWVQVLHKEHTDLKLNMRTLTLTHFLAAAVLAAVFLVGKIGAYKGVWDKWVNISVGSAFLLYSAIVSVFTDGALSDLEKGLLPIIPFYGPLHAVKRFLHLDYHQPQR